MNRRDFVKALLSTVAAAAVLPHLESFAEAMAPRWWKGAETLTRGDIFCISGVYARNPKTYAVTDHLQHFVITADVVNEGDEPRIAPQMITEGPYANVSNLPGDDAELLALMWDFSLVPVSAKVDAQI